MTYTLFLLNIFLVFIGIVATLILKVTRYGLSSKIIYTISIPLLLIGAFSFAYGAVITYSIFPDTSSVLIPGFINAILAVGLIYHNFELKRALAQDKLDFSQFEISNDFKKFYSEKIIPLQAKYELERKIYLQKTIITFVTPYIFLIPCTFIIMAFWPNFPIELFIALYIPPFFPAYRIICDYANYIRNNIYPIIFEYFAKDVKYEAKGSFNVNDIINFGIIPRFHAQINEHQLQCNYQNFNIITFHSVLTKVLGI